MILVQDYLSEKQQDFKNHPFFKNLDKQNNFLDTMAFTPKLTFWVMVFQDVLKLIPPRIQAKELRRIATHHKIEDSGHDQWFLQDISFLHQDNNHDIAWLFGKDNELIRNFSYNIVSEALTLPMDYLRIILILILESTGHVFFENIAKFVQSKGYDPHLKYFSSFHLEVEHNHAIFEESLNKELFCKELSPEEYSQAIALIDRVYQGFNKLFSHLDAYLTQEHLDKLEGDYESENLVA